MTVALAQVAELVYQESGIRLANHQHAYLEAALDRVETGVDPEQFLRRAANPVRRSALITRLIEEVTVKETSFLRDHEQLAGIDWRRLLEAAQARGLDAPRVWIAPCATGEEAYSVAMLACEAFAPARPPVRILATDISADALAQARLGSYGPRSARALDPVMRKRYFSEQGDRLVVGEKLRSLVRFARHNLVGDPFPPLGEAPFQLILCRNVLIYFDAEVVGRVLDSFERALARPGTLVLGVADALCATASRVAKLPAGAPSATVAPLKRRQDLRRPLGRSPVGHEDPLDAAAYFERGLAELESDDPAAAVGSLRRALYAEPLFGLAAFKLGGALESLGDAPAARRAYEQALRALEPDERHETLLAQVDLADIARATRARLDVLEPGSRTGAGTWRRG
jgi:chemotaxis methyl-accepting protein methylase